MKAGARCLLAASLCAVPASAFDCPSFGSSDDPAPQQASPAPPVEITPAQAELNRAYQLLREKRVEEAVAAFERVLELDPENRLAHLELAYLYTRLGRWPEVVKHLTVASRQDPENLRLRMELGYALQNLGELTRAAEQFQFVAERPGELQEEARRALEAVRQLEAQRSEEAVAALAERLARRDAYLNHAYAHLRAGDRAAARQSFERALEEDPQNPLILKQLGYMALQDENLELAVQRFEAARRAAPEDHELALQLGYLYDRLKRYDQAEESFQAAAPSPDPQVRTSAERALKVLRAERRRFYFDVYANPIFSTRFDNFIFYSQTQLGFRPRPRSPVTLYLGTRLSVDSRSTGGRLPAVFSDNVFLVGGGVLLQPRGWHLYLYGEVNLAVNLKRFAPDRLKRTEPDYRVVLGYYRLWDGKLRGPLFLATAGRARSDRFFTEVDATLGYYRRYDHNLIGYVQLREGARLAEPGPAQLSGYLKLNLVKDSNRDFFNNLVEFGPGVEFRPERSVNLALRVEYLRGVYFGIQGRDPNPFRPQYNEVRVSLLFGRRF